MVELVAGSSGPAEIIEGETDMKRSVNDELEGIIDQLGLAETLRRIGGVCREKAEHLRVNWQDRESAKRWEAAAISIEGNAEGRPVRHTEHTIHLRG